MTDDWGLEWQDWFRSVQANFPADAPHPFPDDWSRLIRQFEKGHSPKKAADSYGWSPREREFGERLASRISLETGIALEDLPSSRILAIEPRLLLEPYRGSTPLGNVTLSITLPGLDQRTVKPRRYFPNPCHIGGGLDKECRFIFIPVDEGLDAIEVVLNWEVEGRRCAHTIVYHLENTGSGWFFNDSNVVNAHCHQPLGWLSPYWIRHEIDGAQLEERAHLPLDHDAVKNLPRIASQVSQLEIEPGSVTLKEHLHLLGGSPNDSV